MTNFPRKYKLIFSVFLFLTLFVLPSLARPFGYNLSLGPNYWLTNGRKAGIESNLLTCGFNISANLPGRMKADYLGGYGVISNSRTSFNEISLLYNQIDENHLFFGYGILYSNYNYTLDKANNISTASNQLNLKIQWGYHFSPLWGFYAKAFGPNWGYDLGWLAYFDRNLGDYNITLGYKKLSLENETSLDGVYLASSIYF